MFASIELGRRIEAAEARMMTAFAELAQVKAPRGTVLLEPIGGGVAVLLRPASPMNKAIGLGFDGLLDEGRLAAIESAWQERGAPVQVELAALARCEVAQQLASRGYELRAFENVLGCAPASLQPAASAAFTVENADRLDRTAFVDFMVDSFLHGDGSGAGTADQFAREDLVAAMHETMSLPGLRRYAVRKDGAIAGGASMHVDAQGVAQLCGAATAPRFRRQGIQAALLRARLADAAQAGCDVAVITTQPGSKSQANAQRQGFSLLYARAILVKPLP
jgi:ribosomal protein S18 acetylase RimI-like enzyme